MPVYALLLLDTYHIFEYILTADITRETDSFIRDKTSKMKRIAFKMHLNRGQKEEYMKRHENIWPELKKLLKDAGISEYSIFFDEETGILFAFQKVSGDGGSQELGQTEIVRKWWNYMAGIMEVNPDNSPVSTELEEVFYME